MKVLSLFLIFGFFVIGASAQGTVRRIDSLMKSFFQPGLSGAVLAIQKNNTAFFRKGYGIAEKISGIGYPVPL